VLCLPGPLSISPPVRGLLPEKPLLGVETNASLANLTDLKFPAGPSERLQHGSGTTWVT